MRYFFDFRKDYGILTTVDKSDYWDDESNTVRIHANSQKQKETYMKDLNIPDEQTNPNNRQGILIGNNIELLVPDFHALKFEATTDLYKHIAAIIKSRLLSGDVEKDHASRIKDITKTANFDMLLSLSTEKYMEKILGRCKGDVVYINGTGAASSDAIPYELFKRRINSKSFIEWILLFTRDEFYEEIPIIFENLDTLRMEVKL